MVLRSVFQIDLISNNKEPVLHSLSIRSKETNIQTNSEHLKSIDFFTLLRNILQTYPLASFSDSNHELGGYAGISDILLPTVC